MPTNVFLFRDEYSTSEKVDRIPASVFSVDTPEVRAFLGEIGEPPQEVRSLSKSDYLSRARSEVEWERYEIHIEELFEEYGKKGDTFNMQLFTLPGELSYEQLVERSESYEGNRLESVYSQMLAEPVALTNTAKNEERHTVDLCFRTAVTQQEIEPDEDIPIQVIRQGTEEVEGEFGEGFVVRAPLRHQIESRVFVDEGLAAISNSGVRSGLQTNLATIITEMARSGDEQGADQ